MIVMISLNVSSTNFCLNSDCVWFSTNMYDTFYYEPHLIESCLEWLSKLNNANTIAEFYAGF